MAAIERLPWQIEALHRYDKDVNWQDKQGKTALHYAVLSDDRPSCDVLLKFGANRQLKDKDGKTAMDLISKIGNEMDQMRMHAVFEKP